MSQCILIVAPDLFTSILNVGMYLKTRTYIYISMTLLYIALTVRTRPRSYHRSDYPSLCTSTLPQSKKLYKPLPVLLPQDSCTLVWSNSRSHNKKGLMPRPSTAFISHSQKKCVCHGIFMNVTPKVSGVWVKASARFGDERCNRILAILVDE